MADPGFDPTTLLFGSGPDAMAQAASYANALRGRQKVAEQLSFLPSAPTFAGVHSGPSQPAQMMESSANLGERLLTSLLEARRQRELQMALGLGKLGQGQQNIELKKTEQIANPLSRTGLSPKHSGGGGGSGGSGAGTSSGGIGTYDEAGLDKLVDMLATTGKVQIPGGRAIAGAVGGEVYKRFAAKYPSLNPGEVEANFSANKNSLKQLQQTQDGMETYERTALKNAQIYENLIHKVPNTGAPLLNLPFREFAKRVSGDPNMAGLITAHQTAANEIARVVSSPRGTGPLTDDAKRHAGEALGDPMEATPNQVIASLNVLRQDMTNRTHETAVQLGAVRGRIKPGADQTVSPGVDTTPAPGGATAPDRKFYQGKWYRRGPNGEAVPE